MTLEVRLAGQDDLEAVLALRHEVFVVGQGVPAELEYDDLDPDAEHAVALRDGRVVGTGRLLAGSTDEAGRLVPGTAASVGTIGRMAVAETARGSGTGRAMLDLLVARAAERGLPFVELHAQVHARGFYERAGFEPYGAVYLEAGIEHVGMRRRLEPAAPGQDVRVPDADQELAERLLERGWTFAAAESVTAGLVVNRAAQATDASRWLAGGVVAYTAEVKERLLGVEPGPVVNAGTAEQMARGVAALLGVQVAVSTTGVGGPEPQEGEPAGTVWVGVLVDGAVTTHRLSLPGDPEQVCHDAAGQALGLVVEALRR